MDTTIIRRKDSNKTPRGNKTTTVIIPAFNEESGLENVLDKLENHLDGSFDILVVDDGSSDGTAAIVERKQNVRLVQHTHNCGYGAAIKTGVSLVETEWVAFFDADGQHSPKDLIRLLGADESADMIVGARDHWFSDNWRRTPGKFILKLLAIFLTGTRIPDLNSGLRVVNRRVLLRYLHLLPNGFSASTTMTMAFLARNYSVRYLPIKSNKRIGKSSVNQLRDGYGTIVLMLRMIILFNPMKFFGLFSFVFISIGSVYGMVKLIETGVGLSSGALLILFIGLLGFIFGLLCDQISSLRMERFEMPDAMQRIQACTCAPPDESVKAKQYDVRYDSYSADRPTNRKIK